MNAYFALRPIVPTGDLMTIEQVMKRVGCENMSRSEFVRSARRSGLPRIKFNKRVIRYDPLAVEAWIRRRSA